jgi:hypothetical protein
MDRRTRPEQEHLPPGRCRIKILGDLEPVRALLPIRFIPETTNSAGFGETPGPDGSAGHRHWPGDTAGYHPVMARVQPDGSLVSGLHRSRSAMTCGTEAAAAAWPPPACSGDAAVTSGCALAGEELQILDGQLRTLRHSYGGLLQGSVEGCRARCLRWCRYERESEVRDMKARTHINRARKRLPQATPADWTEGLR